MSSVSVVCVTCDKYSKLVPGFRHFLARYWPDRIWPLQIVAERERPWLPPTPDCYYYYYGEDRDWSANVLKFLGKAAPEIVVLLLDDYYLSEPADDSLLVSLVAVMQEDDTIGYVNLRPWSDDVVSGQDWMAWQQVSPRPDVGEYDKETAQYLLSLQPGIWRAKVLRWLLRRGEDGWQAEIRGTERARPASFRMLACLQPFPLPHVNVTRYGDYRDGSREWLVKELGEEHGIVEQLDGLLGQRIL